MKYMYLLEPCNVWEHSINPLSESYAKLILWEASGVETRHLNTGTSWWCWREYRWQLRAREHVAHHEMSKMQLGFVW